MNVRYAAGETTYQEDPAMGRYVEVRYMETGQALQRAR